MSRNHTRLEEVPTYSATVWSSADDVVFKLEVRIEDVGVELRFAVVLVTDLLPVGSCFRHCPHFLLASFSWRCDMRQNTVYQMWDWSLRRKQLVRAQFMRFKARG